MIVNLCPRCKSDNLFFGKVERGSDYATEGILACGDCIWWVPVELIPVDYEDKTKRNHTKP